MSGGDQLLLASANFGGGVDSVEAHGGRGNERTIALVKFLSNPSGQGDGSRTPLVGGVQEMTRLLDPVADYPGTVADSLKGDSFYLPCNTTDWYPIAEKWGRRWAEEGITRMEEGMATFARSGADLAAPSFDGSPKRGNPFTGLVITMPTMEFPSEPDAGSGWIEAAPDFGDVAGGESPVAVRFRPGSYSGNRDTDPRAATAHRVTLPGGGRLVVVNVHLATLRNEIGKDVLTDPGDGLPRSPREPSPEAIFLRYLHLDLLARFVERVYEDLRLPVAVIGDFNATPDAIEMRWFGERTGMQMVFADTCWHCGESLAGGLGSKRFYTSAGAKDVLAESPEVFREFAPAGEEPVAVTVPEVCPNCSAALFTHKRNFRLIDNIFYTGAATSAARGLEGTLEPVADTDGLGGSGLRLDTYFSDHVPIWARLRLDAAGR